MAALDGKVALVTGAASGIGLAIAQALAAEGAQVTLADVDIERGLEAASHIAGARFVAAGLADAGSWPRLVTDTIATPGALDVRVHKPGLQHLAPPHEFPEAQARHPL